MSFMCTQTRFNLIQFALVETNTRIGYSKNQSTITIHNYRLCPVTKF